MNNLKVEIKKIILDAIESGNLEFSIERWNTGYCKLIIGPIYFHREIPAPPLDPNAKKYIILRGDESPETMERLKKEHGGNVNFLPSCTEIRHFSGMQVEISVNGRIIAYCDERDVIMSFGEPHDEE